MDEQFDGSKSYAYQVLAQWDKIGEIAVEWRESELSQAYDSEIKYKYIAMLTRLWGDLFPKIDDTKLDASFVKDYKSFRHYFYDPTLLDEETSENSEQMYKLEEVLRVAIEKLGFTKNINL